MKKPRDTRLERMNRGANAEKVWTESWCVKPRFGGGSIATDQLICRSWDNLATMSFIRGAPPGVNLLDEFGGGEPSSDPVHGDEALRKSDVKRCLGRGHVRQLGGRRSQERFLNGISTGSEFGHAFLDGICRDARWSVFDVRGCFGRGPDYQWLTLAKAL